MLAYEDGLARMGKNESISKAGSNTNISRNGGIKSWRDGFRGEKGTAGVHGGLVGGRRSASGSEMMRGSAEAARDHVMGGSKSVSGIEVDAVDIAALLGVRVVAADMPEFMQVHAFRCARRAYYGQDKFSARQMAHDIKKEFDKAFGSTWHCIVGSSFGSYVTYSRECFLYFSIEKILVMVFKTQVSSALRS